MAVQVGHPAFGQQPLTLIRRSDAVTPQVLDVEVLRQQRIDVVSLPALTDPAPGLLGSGTAAVDVQA